MRATGLVGIRSGLAGLAVLLTAASGFAAGLTTSGLLVRVALAAAGFWALGGLVERIWCPPAARRQPPASSPGARGRVLDVVLPAVKPDADAPVSSASGEGAGR